MRTAIAFMLILPAFLVPLHSQDHIFYDHSEASIQFAAEELQREMLKHGNQALLSPLEELTTVGEGTHFVIAMDDSRVLDALKKAGGTKVENLSEQDYVFRQTRKKKASIHWAIGGDRIGAMYGGIHLAEMMKTGGLEDFPDEDYSPYIRKRGIKFNIPLGDRQPSHDDRGTAAQTNIPHMWDMEFWTAYLDLLAKQRYNVLSLWNQHPFPSMVKLEDYPLVALDDVYDLEGKVKDISIDEKIVFWQEVMEYAHDRGIEVYIITWNIHAHGARGWYGINESYRNEPGKDYLRKSVAKLFQTYPRLAGIGVTAGENMAGMSADEKEEWLWDTYGKGILDYSEMDPDRKIRFIHRYWLTSFETIDSRFNQLKDGYDMSYKYAKARMYSSPHPGFAEKELLPRIPSDKSTWWNIRNDDIYNLRWGDPDYVRSFIRHLPEGNTTAGYYMGSDRYAWGRESISLNPSDPRILENEKHWYNFLLWGRLGYDPDTPNEFFAALIADRFPEVPAQELFSAWQTSSKIVPLVNRFHWYAWDYLWWVEACVSSGWGIAIPGFHDVNHFIQAPTMPGSGLMTIVDYTELVVEDEVIEGKTPLEVADQLDAYADDALKVVHGLSTTQDNELRETLGDIRAMAYLGKYYASKIRGATYLQLYKKTKQAEYKSRAVLNLEKALSEWQNYADILEGQYIKMNIAYHRVFDWDKTEIEVRKDIDIATQAE